MHLRELNFDIDAFLNPIIPRSRLHQLPRPVSRFLGYRDTPNPPIGNVVVALWSFFGAFCGTSVLSGLFMADFIKDRGAPIIIGSYGAAAILEYNVIESPLSQPRNAIFGQFLSALIGVGITKLFALSADFESLRWLAGALAVGLSSAVMTLTKTIHPPAGATALLAATSPQLSRLGWFYLPIVLLSSVLTLGVSCVVNNIQRQFPMYWWTPRNAVAKPADDKEQAAGSDADKALRATTSDGFALHSRDEIVVGADQVLVPSRVYLYLSAQQRDTLKIIGMMLRETKDAPLSDGASGNISSETGSLTSDDVKSEKSGKGLA